MTESEKKYHTATIIICQHSLDGLDQNMLVEFLQNRGADTAPEQFSWINQERETLKIDMVRQLIQDLSYSSYRGKERQVVIWAADKATAEAQNALLKTLEEPPTNTRLWLVVEQVTQLLPTIRSRCYEINWRIEEQSQPDSNSTHDLLTAIPQMSHRELIDEANIVSDRQEALELINTLIKQTHKLLEAEPSSNYTQSLEILLKTEQYLNANVNVKLALEQAFFLLKKSLSRESDH